MALYWELARLVHRSMIILFILGATPSSMDAYSYFTVDLFASVIMFRGWQW